MTEHRPSNDLSPALEAVLSSLSVNLEAELNRYRRNRYLHSAADEDIFADLDAVVDSSSAINFDLESAQLDVPVAALAIASPKAPPPLPPNKKLTQTRPTAQEHSQDRAAESALTIQSHSDRPLADSPEVAFQQLIQPDLDSRSKILSPPSGDRYLSSSEKLIESLTDVAAMPEPVDLNPEPRRKTVSLMAGAALGFLALVAGLGASYVMSNPEMAQTLAGRGSGDRATVDPVSKRTFDPPGPDLSAQEFVDLKLDNLSSLNMRTSLDPLSSAAVPVPPVLPPIERANSLSVAQPAADATQALSIPAGANYYVTVPFSTEQGLIEVRKAVEEAFVRQFSDGNRIQLAVFDNAETAQSFIAKLQMRGVQAQIYGPTTE